MLGQTTDHTHNSFNGNYISKRIVDSRSKTVKMAAAVDPSSSSSIFVNTQVKGKSDWNHAQEMVEELKRERD